MGSMKRREESGDVWEEGCEVSSSVVSIPRAEMLLYPLLRLACLSGPRGRIMKKLRSMMEGKKADAMRLVLTDKPRVEVIKT